jgi:hypothetical protein
MNLPKLNGREFAILRRDQSSTTVRNYTNDYLKFIGYQNQQFSLEPITDNEPTVAYTYGNLYQISIATYTFTKVVLPVGLGSGVFKISL